MRMHASACLVLSRTTHCLTGDCSALCEVLTERGGPFITYSGFGPADAPFVGKPAHPEVIVTLLQNLILQQPPPH